MSILQNNPLKISWENLNEWNASLVIVDSVYDISLN